MRATNLFLLLGVLGAKALPQDMAAGEPADTTDAVAGADGTTSGSWAPTYTPPASPGGPNTDTDETASTTGNPSVATPIAASTDAAGGAGAATSHSWAPTFTSPTAATGGSSNPNATPSESAATPSASVPPETQVTGQDNLPPTQWWCSDGAHYCPGPLLQDVQLSEMFPDSKTFVDKPSIRSINDTLSAFNDIGINKTVGQMIAFVEANFKPEGRELEAVAIEGFVDNPAILNNVTDPIYKAWVSRVNSYWELLIRKTNETALCQPGACESSLIPLNHTVVVPGGRYREIYYWDSFWIMEGLLASELYTYAWNLLQNMFDMVETFGFVPNGGRKYYLNRSQPPVLAQMVDAYVKATGNVTVLERGLPLLHQELLWFEANRTMLITSPFTNRTLRVAHWNVNNSAPRPEGYVEDYTTVMEAEPALNASQRADLYAELASGAESGWDYSSRWCKEPLLNKTDNNPALRTLNVRGIVPVDLTALLAGDHSIVARLYELYAETANSTTTGSTACGGSNGTVAASPTAAPNLNPNATAPVWNATTSCTGAAAGGASPGGGTAPADGQCPVPATGGGTITPDSDKIAYHRAMSANYTAAVNDLHWDPVKAFWYDFNMTSMTRSEVFTPAGLWPLWQNATPVALTTNETLGLEVVSGLRFLLGKYPGSPSVASLLDTGLNWDFPNVWPPHAYTTIKAMEALGRLIPGAGNVTTTVLSAFPEVAPGQLGVNFTDLPLQPNNTIGNTSLTVPGLEALAWPKALAAEIANRYMSSAFCSWYSTGGSLPGVLSQLPLADLNTTGTYQGDEGHMFEKFNVTDPDAAGGGGEYTVVTGFGWTNGVVLWAAGQYGKYLPTPTCPTILITPGNLTAAGAGGNSTDSTSNATDTTSAVGENSTAAADTGSNTASTANTTSISDLSAREDMFFGRRRHL